MKKIFLTSGIIACMACPAFAAGSGFPSTSDGNTVNNACTEPYLGVYTGPTTLKAQWTANKGTISLHNNSSYTNGCSPAQTVTHTANDSNWASIFTAATSGTGNDAITDITTLYTTYGVGVYPDSATQGADTADAGVGAITSLTTIPALTGYVFGGYYTDLNDSTTQKISALGVIDSSVKDMVTTSGGSDNLYAKWTPKTYTTGITYACGSTVLGNVSVKQEGGVNVSLTQSVTYDDCYSLDNVTNRCEAPSGYTFGGWSCSSDLPGATKTLPAGAQTPTYYAAGAGGTWTTDLAANATVTCEAIWVAEQITITWDDDDATTFANDGTPSCSYGASVTVPTKPTKTGYTFGGWTVVTAQETTSSTPTPEECAENPELEGC